MFLRDAAGLWHGQDHTDENGLYEIRHAEAGRYVARVGRSGVWTGASSAGFDVPEGAALVQAPDLLVSRGLSLVGTASIAPGVPVPRETDLRLWDVAANTFVDSEAVPEGRFRFDGLEPGTYRLALFADGRGSQLFADANGHLGQEITLTDSDVEYDLVAEIVPLEER